jgi:hypothetical protein
MEESHGRPEAAPIFWVFWAEKLLLQMDERSRHLNQPFEEAVVLITPL